MSKTFIKINEEFKCENCGHFNQKAKKTCRNHCSQCLFSKHLDKNGPGDRASDCHGLMKPINIEIIDGKEKIIHKCQKCEYQIKNKTLEDDNREIIYKIMEENARNF